MFPMRESLQPPPPLADFMADDGISWARLVTAIVSLGLSLAIGYRTSRDPPRPRAVPQPVPERMVAGVELVPLVQTEVAPLPVQSVPSPAAAAPAGPARAEPLRTGEARRAVRAANRSSPGPLRPRRRHAAVAVREPGAVRRSVRTRAQVQREYPRSRDGVAALTGEDSGSAYLARLAARQRAASLEGAGHRRR